MGHFVAAYFHQPEVPSKTAADKVLQTLAQAKWDNRETVRVRDGNPWIQVEGFWPDAMIDIGRALTGGAAGGTAVVIEEETVSGCFSYFRFRNGKFVFRYSKCEDNREQKGKPLDWEQKLFSGTDDDAVYSLGPIAKHLQLPGFEEAQPKYWLVEKSYRPA